MTCLSKTLLVLLRLAIGWHFFIEGVSKLETYHSSAPPLHPPGEVTKTQYGGPPDHPIRPVLAPREKKTKKPWSSEVYLREANGPLAGVFHWLAGDPLLDRLEVLPRREDEPADKLYLRMPPALERDWRAYFDVFVAHFHIEGKQLEQMEAHFKQRASETVRWLLEGVRPTAKVPVAGNATVDIDVKTPERIEKYKRLTRKVADLQATSATATFNPRLARDLEDARGDLGKARAELQSDLDAETAALKAALRNALTPDQLEEADDVPVPLSPHWQDWGRLEWIDFSTRWGLAIVGGLLLVGLFTRAACIGGALFLLMFYLSMPPFPGLPANPRAEGHYLIINKNLIEMLALLALATTYSGRWLGLDALVRYICPCGWKKRATRSPDELARHPVHDARPVEPQPRTPALLEHDPFKPIPLLAPEPNAKEPPHGN